MMSRNEGVRLTYSAPLQETRKNTPSGLILEVVLRSVGQSRLEVVRVARRGSWTSLPLRTCAAPHTE